VSTFAIFKNCFISIYELGMQKIYHANKPTFGNLDWLLAHHFNGSSPFAFFTWNMQNKESSTLRRPLDFSFDEAINPNNPFEGP